MNRRIRKKKEKQRQEMINHLAAALVELKETVDAAEKAYWRQWAEESTRQFVETVFRHCERRYGKEGLTQSSV